MNRTVEYYLALPYTIEMVPDPDGGWVVSVKELPGCLSQGDTPEEAIEMIEDAKRAWIEVALEDGYPVPEPRELESYSGKFVVRVPRSLHRDLSEQAEREGVSLNQYINVALARAAGWPAAGSDCDPQADAGWPGLQAGLRRVLAAAGHAAEAGELDEALFSRWVDDHLMQIESAIQGGYWRDALGYLDAMTPALNLGATRSPVLKSLLRSLRLLYQQVRAYVELQQGFFNEVQMRSRISSHIMSVNSALMQSVVHEERRAYSESTTISEARVGEPVLTNW
jgi:antitoxin HicB